MKGGEQVQIPTQINNLPCSETKANQRIEIKGTIISYVLAKFNYSSSQLLLLKWNFFFEIETCKMKVNKGIKNKVFS